MPRKKVNKKHRFKVTCPIVLKPTFFVEATVPELTKLGALKKVRDLDLSVFFSGIREAMNNLTTKDFGEVFVEPDS